MARFVRGMTNFVKSITKEDVKQAVGVVIVVEAGSHVTGKYVGHSTWCIGPSMEPTIPTQGTFVLVNSYSYSWGEKKTYNVGDIVISISPNDPDKQVCKRIAAVAGDEVIIHSKNKHHYSVRGSAPIIIPPGHVWLAGDNTNNSYI